MEKSKNEAYRGVRKKIAPVEGEQGAAKDAGGTPNENFGHGSAKSAGVGGQIPKES